MKSFTGSAAISNKRKKIQEELRRGVGSNEYVIATYGVDTDEYLEAKLDLEEKQNELNKKIELSCGFEELRTILNDFEAFRNWKMNKEIERQGEIEHQLPIIQEEGENELGRRFRKF